MTPNLMPNMVFKRPQRGFTLVEMIVAIVLTAIIAGTLVLFIRRPVTSYLDSAGRAEMTDVADLALRRMAREIRLALPNSVRVNADGSAMEFLLTKTGGRYLAVEDAATSGTPLDFANNLNLSFTVVGGLQAPLAASDYVVVYNLGPGFAPADAYTFGQAQTNIARVEAAAPGATEIVMKTNPFARSEPMPSPGSRFQIVSTPVTYRCESVGANMVLSRYAGYDIRPNITDAMSGAGKTSATLARRLSACAGLFSYDVADVELRRSALVLLALSLHTRGGGDTGAGSIRLIHQVRVDNTP